MKKTIFSLLLVFCFFGNVSAATNTGCDTSTATTKQPETKLSETNIEKQKSQSPIIPIIINEFLPDPEGSDSDNEWIELKNPTDQIAILDGWALDDAEGGSKPFALDGYKIQPESFLIIKSSENKIALNNTNDEVRLMDYHGNVIDKVAYEKTNSGKSIARKTDNTWEEAETPTPGTENIFPLSITDAEQQTLEQQPTVGQLSDDIEISEVLPNPTGEDKNHEWIELHNNSDEAVNLENWKIVTKNKKFTIDKTFTIKPGEYMILKFDDIGITLKNGENEIRLLDPEDNEMDAVSYDNAPEGIAFSKITTHKEMKNNSGIPTAYAAGQEQAWQWTTDITEAEKNPAYYIFEGKINEQPSSNGFQIKNGNETKYIAFTEEKLNPDLARLILKPGIEIEVIAEKNGEQYNLEKYEILSSEENGMSGTKGFLGWIITFSGFLIIGSYFGYRKFVDYRGNIY